MGYRFSLQSSQPIFYVCIPSPREYRDGKHSWQKWSLVAVYGLKKCIQVVYLYVAYTYINGVGFIFILKVFTKNSVRYTRMLNVLITIACDVHASCIYWPKMARDVHVSYTQLRRMAFVSRLFPTWGTGTSMYTENSIQDSELFHIPHWVSLLVSVIILAKY